MERGHQGGFTKINRISINFSGWDRREGTFTHFWNIFSTYVQNPKYGNSKLFYLQQFWQVPPALGWIAVISWSFMLTVGPNMGTTKNKQNRLSFLLNIFNTRNYILNRILDGHFRGDTKQEKLLSFLWITRDSSLIQLIWRKVRTN